MPDDRAAIPAEILRQAKVAIESATLLVLVVDSRDGLTPLDEELARLLRRTGKPIVVAANKVDSQQQESLTGPLHSLGLPVFPLSAEHGYGMDNLLDYIVEHASIASVMSGLMKAFPPKVKSRKARKPREMERNIGAPKRKKLPFKWRLSGGRMSGSRRC